MQAYATRSAEKAAGAGLRSAEPVDTPIQCIVAMRLVEAAHRYQAGQGGGQLEESLTDLDAALLFRARFAGCALAPCV